MMHLLGFKSRMLPVISGLLLLLLTSCSSNTEKTKNGQAEASGVAVLLVDADHPVSTIDKNIYGHFLEHINHSVEDGLYAEQVQGQGFEGKDWETYWKPLAKSGKVELINTHFAKGDKSIRLTADNGIAGISQKRIYVKKEVSYNGSVWVKREAGNPQISLRIRDAGNSEIAKVSLPYSDTGWKEVPFAFTAPRT